MSLTYAALQQLKHGHGAWRLLGADHAPLILSFLDHVFMRPNVRSIPQARLVELLEEELNVLRAKCERFPQSAQHYLDQWASGEAPFLRKYYPDQSDEPEFEPLPSAEKAVEFVRGLEQAPFVGTASRLLTVVQLLRDVVQATETDPEARLAELERRKSEIEREIARVQAGLIETANPTQVRERYLQAEETARRLLGDFRQVEENFRELHEALLHELLPLVAPEGTWGPKPAGTHAFERRFGLKFDPALVRFRALDERVAIAGLMDLTVPISDFARAPPGGGEAGLRGREQDPGPLLP